VRRKTLLSAAWAENYPLRPELAESCYALYRATADPAYLRMGAEMVRSLNSLARVDGGFAAISSVRKHTQGDHMASFFLAETLKYLYLLFDEANFLNVHSTSFVFTTEAHLVPLSVRFSAPTNAAAVHVSAERLARMTVSQMKKVVTSAGLSFNDCIERSDLLTRTTRAMSIIEARVLAEEEREAVARQLERHEALVCPQVDYVAVDLPPATAPRPPSSPPSASPPSASPPQAQIRQAVESSRKRARRPSAEPRHVAPARRLDEVTSNYVGADGVALYAHGRGVSGLLSQGREFFVAAGAAHRLEDALHLMVSAGRASVEWALHRNGSLTATAPTSQLSLWDSQDGAAHRPSALVTTVSGVWAAGSNTLANGEALRGRVSLLWRCDASELEGGVPVLNRLLLHLGPRVKYGGTPCDVSKLLHRAAQKGALAVIMQVGMPCTEATEASQPFMRSGGRMVPPEWPMAWPPTARGRHVCVGSTASSPPGSLPVPVLLLPRVALRAVREQLPIGVGSKRGGELEWSAAVQPAAGHAIPQIEREQLGDVRVLPITSTKRSGEVGVVLRTSSAGAESSGAWISLSTTFDSGEIHAQARDGTRYHTVVSRGSDEARAEASMS